MDGGVRGHLPWAAEAGRRGSGHRAAGTSRQYHGRSSSISEFVPGIPLDTALAEFGPLPLPAAFHLVGRTARALAAIHAADVVHRDLKPSNIMLAASGPYVIDFGIARATDATQLTSVGGRIGTPHFMSPEHALGEAVGYAGDFFSLGLIAAVAATGRHPYGEGGWMTVATKIANSAEHPPDLSGYPEELRPLLHRCLTVDPAARITADEAVELCERGAGRPLRDAEGWLPAPLDAAVGRRARAVESLWEPVIEPEPEAARGTLPPWGPVSRPAGSVPPSPGTGYGTGPSYGTGTGSGHGPAPAAPGTGPHEGAVPPPSAPARFTGGLRRKVLMGVAAAVLLVAGTFAVKAILPGDKPAPGPDPTGGPTPGPTATGGGKPVKDPTGPARPAYTTLVKDRPFELRSPRDSDDAGVDLDIPRVNSRTVDYDKDEIIIGSVLKDRWEFQTPFGKGAGESPEKCLEGSQSDALPGSVDYQEFEETIPVGTLLCTVTDKDNLAMLKVTKVTPTHDGDLPDVSGRLTVWKKQ
ncbi:serine/threonine protein kinase [Streptomyces sp. NPDC048644]|uniref:serine/threonine protein kinase n=1 Tax=Streptomyces sp. NPDC048644 TaxID=3365582 RepID=UPI00372289A4